MEPEPTLDDAAPTAFEPEPELFADLAEPETVTEEPQAEPTVGAFSAPADDLGPLMGVPTPPAEAEAPVAPVGGPVEAASEPAPAEPNLAEPDLIEAIDALFAPRAPVEAPPPVEPPEMEAPLTLVEPAPEAEAQAAPFAATARAPRPARRKAPPAAQLFLAFTTLLALTPPLLILAAAIGVREGLIDWRYGLGELMIDWPFKLASVGLVGGVMGLFAALMAGFRRLWRKALISLLLPVAVLGGLFTVKAASDSYPPVHDVATSWSPPIGFSAALIAARGPEAAPVSADPFVPLTATTYMSRRVADVNAETCPGAHTAVLAATPENAYALAKAAVRAAGLQLFIDDPDHGRLEAVATDPWLGFKDDLAVRVTPDPSDPRAAHVDMRSVSRNDTPDFGANCARVSRLIATIGG